MTKKHVCLQMHPRIGSHIIRTCAIIAENEKASHVLGPKAASFMLHPPPWWNSEPLPMGPVIQMYATVCLAPGAQRHGPWNPKVLPSVPPPSQNKVQISLNQALCWPYCGIGGGIEGVSSKAMKGGFWAAPPS